MSKKSKRSLKKKNINIEKNKEKESFKILFWESNPDLTAIGIILILLLVFFSPVLFSNKTMLPPDKVASDSFIPFVDDALNKGEYPLWNPYIFGGMPSFGSLSRAPFTDVVSVVIKYGVIWIADLVFPLSDFTSALINYLLLGGLIYFLLRSKKIYPGAALFCSIALVLLPQVVAYTAFGHSTKLKTFVLVPLIFLLLERLLKKGDLLYFCSLGLVLGLQLLRKHVQICFYTQFMIGIYFIYWAVMSYKDNKKIGKILKGAGLVIGVIVLGFLVSSVVNLSVWEYTQYSMRGGGETGGLDYSYATNWSFPPTEIATFFIPSFMGFGGQTYWGSMPFTDFPIYFSIIVLFLAGLAMVINRNRTTWFFTIFAGIVLLLSFGKHLPVLYGPMFKFFPLFDKFRAPKMVMIMFMFSMVILAGYGIQGIIDFIDNKKEEHIKKVKLYMQIFGGVLALLFIILLLGKGAYLSWASKLRSPAEAYNKATADGVKALFLFGLSAGIVFMALKNKIGRRIFIVPLLVLLVFDLWTVNNRFLDFKPVRRKKTDFDATPEVKYLKSQKGYFRILPVNDGRSPNWYQYHFLQSSWGYQGAKVKVFQELMEGFKMLGGPGDFLKRYLKIENGRYALKKSSELSEKELAVNHNFLKLMNVKYLVCPFPIPDTSMKSVDLPEKRGANGIMEFKEFLPRLFFPKEIRIIDNKDDIFRFMRSTLFDPSETAVIEKESPFNIQPSDSNKAQITEYGNHIIEITADIRKPSLMVLSEIYYPAGWKAYIDGHETEIYKTDYLLRSVFLRPGKHTIVFKFRPRMFYTGLTISIITFMLLSAGIIISWRAGRKKKVLDENVLEAEEK